MRPLDCPIYDTHGEYDPSSHNFRGCSMQLQCKFLYPPDPPQSAAKHHARVDDAHRLYYESNKWGPLDVTSPDREDDRASDLYAFHASTPNDVIRWVTTFIDDIIMQHGPPSGDDSAFDYWPAAMHVTADVINATKQHWPDEHETHAALVKLLTDHYNNVCNSGDTEHAAMMREEVGLPTLD